MNKLLEFLERELNIKINLDTEIKINNRKELIVKIIEKFRDDLLNITTTSNILNIKFIYLYHLFDFYSDYFKVYKLSKDKYLNTLIYFINKNEINEFFDDLGYILTKDNKLYKYAYNSIYDYYLCSYQIKKFKILDQLNTLQFKIRYEYYTIIADILYDIQYSRMKNKYILTCADILYNTYIHKSYYIISNKYIDEKHIIKK
ncbi:MAG: hypothetical protein KatS3mg068_2664 [Candidatus Sericytochromatia bacterium]|nr:MAG: hypothetical protein KatS3mg068_2664 [Candidatus Sericytochromatia bacterium]